MDRRSFGADRALFPGAIALLLAVCGVAAFAAPASEFTATGQSITPAAAKGAIFQALNPGLAALPDFTAGQASALALSPDGRTLLILTSGYNRNLGADGKPVARRPSSARF